MDAQNLLDQLLQSAKKLAEQGLSQGSELAVKGKELGKELAEGGLNYAQQALKIPAAGPEREKSLKHLGTGAAVGGILALLLGTQGGRRTLSRVAKVGSLAALGVLGYKIYAEHQKHNGLEVLDAPTGFLTSSDTNNRCLMIVQAMIAAAKADGRVDEQEQKVIQERIRDSKLEESVTCILLSEIQRPLVVQDVAALAKTQIEGVDIFLASLMVLESPSAAEQQYLADLAQALELDPALVNRLESEAFRPI